MELKVDDRIQTLTITQHRRPRSEGEPLLASRVFRGLRPEQLQRGRTLKILESNLKRLYPGTSVEVHR